MHTHHLLAPLWPWRSAVAGYSLLLIIAARALASPAYASVGGDPQSASAPCRLRGGGCLRPAGGDGSHLQATFGGTVARQRGPVDPAQSTWDHIYVDGRTFLINFHSTDAQVVHCQPDPHGSCPPPDGTSRAEFEGTGKVVLARIIHEDQRERRFCSVATFGVKSAGRRSGWRASPTRSRASPSA